MATSATRQSRPTRAAMAASLGTATVYLALTVPETQIKTAWAASPWRQDPYHTAVLMAQFAAPVLALLIGLRAAARHAPGRADRSRQLLRAALVMTGFVAVAVAFEWAAVVADASPPAGAHGTGLQVAGLAVVTVACGVTGVLLVRTGQATTAQSQHDWLGDIVFLSRRVPVLRSILTREFAAWVRHHTHTAFALASLAVAALLTTVQSVAERTTDPLFIGWLLVALTASVFAFCAASNAVAGFVAPAPRTRLRRDLDVAITVGCVATLVAIAFHDPLWRMIGSGRLTPGSLAALTLGAGLLTTLGCAAVLRLRRQDDRAERCDAAAS